METFWDTKKDLEILGKSRSDLAVVAAASAVEIDNYRLGKPSDFGYTQKLKGVFELYQLRIGASLLDFLPKLPNNFSYHSLWKSFNEKKEMGHTSDVALEMRLLVAELKNITELNPERLKELSSFLCAYTQNLLAEDSYFMNLEAPC